MIFSELGNDKEPEWSLLAFLEVAHTVLTNHVLQSSLLTYEI